MKRIHRRVLLGLAAVAAAAVLVFAALAMPDADTGPEVDGGAILVLTEDSLTVRCLGPEVTLRPNGHAGTVTFTNCFPNCTLTGSQEWEASGRGNISCTLSGSEEELTVGSCEKMSFRFAVMADSQGVNDILAEALEAATGCEFIIHMGDMTPSGQPSEYDAFESTLRNVSTPVLTTPGNHDVKLDGYDEYTSRFGPAAYSFEYSGTTFAFVDSSDLSISEEEIEWLSEEFAEADKKVLVTHAPSYDPFGDNHTLDPASCDRIQDFVLEEEVDVVLTGHIHAYHLMNVEGTDLLISGGAGGTLVDGVHHIVVVTVDETGFHFEKVDLYYVPPPSPQIQVIGKDGSSLNLTYDELLAMDLIEGDSSFENQFGNIDGDGHYEGVLVRDLIDMVGGMAEGDVLKVTAMDGYAQEFGYLNAYPDTTWLSIQGEMVVAMEFDGVVAPEWEDGPRLAMLPEDGLYSNLDCELTSYEGQGYWVYESAGARWVRNVLTITVEAAP